VTISSKKCFPKNFAGKNYNGISFQNLTRSNRNDNCEYIYYSLLVRLGCLAMILQKQLLSKPVLRRYEKFSPKKRRCAGSEKFKTSFNSNLSRCSVTIHPETNATATKLNMNKLLASARWQGVSWQQTSCTVWYV